MKTIGVLVASVVLVVFFGKKMLAYSVGPLVLGNLVRALEFCSAAWLFSVKGLFVCLL